VRASALNLTWPSAKLVPWRARAHAESTNTKTPNQPPTSTRHNSAKIGILKHKSHENFIRIGKLLLLITSIELHCLKDTSAFRHHKKSRRSALQPMFCCHLELQALSSSVDTTSSMSLCLYGKNSPLSIDALRSVLGLVLHLD
jgi:hypothetical protein